MISSSVIYQVKQQLQEGSQQLHQQLDQSLNMSQQAIQAAKDKTEKEQHVARKLEQNHYLQQQVSVSCHINMNITSC